MNTVSLIGRLTADPELRYFETGKSVAKFSIAVNRTKEETDFFDVEAWEKTAEVAGQYCRKGSQVGISGSLVQERWRDKTTGTGRSKVVVRCSRLELLGSRAEGEGQSYQPAAVAPQSYAPQPVYAAPQPQSYAPQQPAPVPQAPAPSYATQGAGRAAAEPAQDIDYNDIPF
jgi:single-strand DNA-binding protein